MWESYFHSVLLMEPVAVLMPDLLYAELCHACSPKWYFSFGVARRSKADDVNARTRCPSSSAPGSLGRKEADSLIFASFPSWAWINCGYQNSSQLPPILRCVP